jgi:hypothetical protein
MHPAEFEPIISAGDWPQSHVLKGVATETGIQKMIITEMGHNHFNYHVNDLRYYCNEKHVEGHDITQFDVILSSTKAQNIVQDPN